MCLLVGTLLIRDALQIYISELLLFPWHLLNSPRLKSDKLPIFADMLVVLCRYVQLPADEVDTQLLQDATRKEAAQNKQ